MISDNIIYSGNIIALWAYALFLLYMIGKAKYGAWKSIVRRVMYKDKSGIQWFLQNKEYITSYLLVLPIGFLSVTLLSQLNIGMPHVRDELTALVSGCIWFMLGLHTRYLYNASKRNNTE